MNKIVQLNGRVKLDIRPELGKPFGKIGTKFVTECGIQVRNFAPRRVKRWSDIGEEDKQALYRRLLVHLNPHFACDSSLTILFANES